MFPNVGPADAFSATWTLAKLPERWLLSKRQNRTAWATYWALVSACRVPYRPFALSVTISSPAPWDDADLVAEATGAEYAGAEGKLTYDYRWARSRDGGKTWSGWGWAGQTLSAGFTSPWDM